jgi:transposase-like protein
MQKKTRSEWEAIVADYRSSDLTLLQAAAKHDIGHHSLAYWVCKLNRESRGKTPTSFVPLVVQEQQRGVQHFEAETRHGLRLKFEFGSDPRYVAQLLSAVS